MADKKQIERTIEMAVKAKANAYCPYSKFRVGAAVLGDNGSIYSGVNVENVSSPCGCCAEVSAISACVTDLCVRIVALALCTDVEDPNFTWPCGKCRQMINEFSEPETAVISVNKQNKRFQKTMLELLPFAFS